MNNPYLFLLQRSLLAGQGELFVQHGHGWLYEEGDWDVIHLHWPELLVKALLADPSRKELLKPELFEKVIRRLKELKKRGSRIVTTIHNEKPHKDSSERYLNFYRSVYGLTDGFIHMGEASGRVTQQDYPEETRDKPSFIIPHGDYSFFPNQLSGEECRRKLGIEDGKKVILAFGAIRNRKELELGIDAFKSSGLPGSLYLIAGSLPNPYKSQLDHYKSRKKLYLNRLSSRIRVDERVIPPSEVQLYLNSADLLLIPRFNTLNSGNVALGYTFGRVVAGPNYGVIGEVLSKTGNPVFDPQKPQTVGQAILEGIRLSETDLGNKNRAFAGKEMNWDQISQQTIKAYQAVIHS